jgi:hypothetical protein
MIPLSPGLPSRFTLFEPLGKEVVGKQKKWAPKRGEGERRLNSVRTLSLE